MNVDEIISNTYYNPEKGLRSYTQLYEELKRQGITLKQIKDFINKQEVKQLHYKPRKPVYFPIFSKHKNHIWQIDLTDLSEIENYNNHVKYLLCCIDIFSRFVYVVPLKNKSSSTISKALNDIFEISKPKILCSDNGSEFKNIQVSNLCKKFNVSQTFFQVGDKHKMAMVERFNRTIRSLINKYLTAYHTSKYINVLGKLVHNYNNTYHSGIQDAPIKADPEKVKRFMVEKYIQALKNEKEYNIGQNVRYVINKTKFEKGSNPRWSKQIYKIISKVRHSYFINKKGVENKSFKYYELQPVREVEMKEINEQPSRQLIKKENKRKRILAREGIQTQNIITHPRKLTQSTRIQPNVILPIGQRTQHL